MKLNRKAPKRIIIYRSGTLESERELLANAEIDPIEGVCKVSKITDNIMK